MIVDTEDSVKERNMFTFIVLEFQRLGWVKILKVNGTSSTGKRESDLGWRDELFNF
jgi:hypothetical protein